MQARKNWTKHFLRGPSDTCFVEQLKTLERNSLGNKKIKPHKKKIITNQNKLQQYCQLQTGMARQSKLQPNAQYIV